MIARQPSPVFTGAGAIPMTYPSNDFPFSSMAAGRHITSRPSAAFAVRYCISENLGLSADRNSIMCTGSRSRGKGISCCRVSGSTRITCRPETGSRRKFPVSTSARTRRLWSPSRIMISLCLRPGEKLPP